MISIIIPTYNSAKTINRCLDSIGAQTYKDYEVLVMDGCSKDETIEIIKSYPDERIKIASEPDKGIYDAMNKGILKSKEEWLYFLGSDDYLFAPDVLEKVAAELSPKYMIVYGDVESTHLQPEYKGEWKETMMYYNRCHQAIFYHRSLFEKYGLYNTSYRIFADHIFNLLCFWKYSVPAKYLDLIIAHYSEGGASERYDDLAFYRDVSWILFRCDKHNRNIKYRKEMVYEALRREPSKNTRLWMHMYLYYLRLIAKLHKLYN